MRNPIFLFFLLLLSLPSFATHFRAGEIEYEVVGNNSLHYRVSINLYTTDINVPPDSDSIKVAWGDRDTTIAYRQTNQPLGNDIKKNTYVAEHIYHGPAPFYIISVSAENRIGGICNINYGSSLSLPMYLEDTLRIYDPAFFGYNSSPRLLYPPIDFATVGEIFYHNPLAYDADGDSLSFQLVPSLWQAGTPVPNYQYPDEILSGSNNNITINSKTGEIIWDVPQKVCIFNVAILITEYRNGIEIGTMIRDMEIIVEDGSNAPPEIAAINDTCVIAGSNLSIDVSGIDPNTGQTVTLNADGGPFRVDNSPAQFTAQNGIGSATGTFTWQTTCDHIRKQFYQVVFRATDDHTIPLVDLESWLIEVVAPPPENVQATAVGNDIFLSWDNYNCFNADNFIGFSVWRREGSNPFSVDTCETGLAGRGYVKIADKVQDHEYLDDDVIRGKNYCYRVLAEFAEETPGGFYYNKVESLPSNEACAELKKDAPLITNVSVLETDKTQGKIFVRWTKPRLPDLDTTQLNGPYSFRLLRSQGFGINNPNFQSIATFSGQNFLQLSDTTFVDSLLNTVDQPYSYLVKFYSNGNLPIDSSEIASSVYLTANATEREIHLSWEEYVPWTNTEYVIYREISNTFIALDTVADQAYVDGNLVKDSMYCYKVLSVGAYSAGALAFPLLNYSQETCASPTDSIGPCPPVLNVWNGCNSEDAVDPCSEEFVLVNHLDWIDGETECSKDIQHYNIYYRSPFVDDFSLIYSTEDKTKKLYDHELEGSLAGCYKITAVDSTGNEGKASEVICVDNCPCYQLPNVFTPNNDGQNDYYTPIMPYAFVEKVDMKIYNRWGDLVFETHDPDIRWDGRDFKTGKLVKEGVYYYTCRVFETYMDGISKGDYLSGYIHLIRGKK